MTHEDIEEAAQEMEAVIRRTAEATLRRYIARGAIYIPAAKIAVEIAQLARDRVLALRDRNVRHTEEDGHPSIEEAGKPL